MVVAEETASLGGTSQSKAASRKAASGSAARADGKTVDAAHVHAPEQQTAARGPPRSKSSTTSESGGGKHAYARSRLSELEQKRGAMVGAGQGAPGGGRNPFELPPIITDTFGRNAEFMKRAFSVEALFEPLPGPLKTSLSRNFGFFKRIFTQFTDPNEKKNIAKSIPGVGK